MRADAARTRTLVHARPRKRMMSFAWVDQTRVDFTRLQLFDLIFKRLTAINKLLQLLTTCILSQSRLRRQTHYSTVVDISDANAPGETFLSLVLMHLLENFRRIVANS